MTTVEIDAEVLRGLVMPGLNLRIVDCRWASDAMRDAVLLEVDSPDVPACDRAVIEMSRSYDPSGPAVTWTARIKAVGG